MRRKKHIKEKNSHSPTLFERYEDVKVGLDQFTTKKKLKKGNQKSEYDSNKETFCPPSNKNIAPENQLFLDVQGQSILVTTQSDQLNILGQTFRPIFCGKVVEVTNGHITLDPVIIKMSNAPFHRFPTPLCFPIEKIANFVAFDCEIQFPIP